MGHSHPQMFRGGAAKSGRLGGAPTDSCLVPGTGRERPCQDACLLAYPYGENTQGGLVHRPAALGEVTQSIMDCRQRLWLW